MSRSSPPEPPGWQFDWMAPLYDWMTFHRDWDRLFKYFDPSPDDRILDLGGGTAQLSSRIAERLPGDARNVVVLDTNEPMLKQGLKKPVRSSFVRGSALNLPFEDESFDRVFTGDALHHMGDLPRVLTEVHRVLVPSGRFLVEEFHPGTWRGKIVGLIESLTGMKSTFYTPDELLDRARGAGFSVEAVSRGRLVYYLEMSRPGG